MQHIWAPWRLQYIQSVGKEEGCFFCHHLKSKQDKKNLVLFRTKHSFCVLNLFPYSNGHLMVAPRKHTGTLDTLTEKELADILITTRLGKRILKKALNADGFNIGMNIGRVAGAGVEHHVHLHIVPRWHGDTNYMPVIAGTKVIPEAIEKTYEKLKRFAKSVLAAR